MLLISFISSILLWDRSTGYGNTNILLILSILSILFFFIYFVYIIYFILFSSLLSCFFFILFTLIGCLPSFLIDFGLCTNRQWNYWYVSLLPFIFVSCSRTLFAVRHSFYCLNIYFTYLDIFPFHLLNSSVKVNHFDQCTNRHFEIFWNYITLEITVSSIVQSSCFTDETC